MDRFIAEASASSAAQPAESGRVSDQDLSDGGNPWPPGYRSSSSENSSAEQDPLEVLPVDPKEHRIDISTAASTNGDGPTNLICAYHLNPEHFLECKRVVCLMFAEGPMRVIGLRYFIVEHIRTGEIPDVTEFVSQWSEHMDT